MIKLFSALILISGVGLIISVLLQESKSEGMGAIAGGNQKIWGKGALRTKEAILHKITTVTAITFMVSAIVIAAIQ